MRKAGRRFTLSAATLIESLEMCWKDPNTRISPQIVLGMQLGMDAFEIIGEAPDDFDFWVVEEITLHQSGSMYNTVELFTEVNRYCAAWRSEMERTKLKYRHFGTGEASHDNCMWRFVVKEFGGRDGKQIVCEDQTHFIRVSQVLRNLRADNTYEDMLAIMKTNVDHRSFQSVPSVQWHASLHKITSSQPKCDEWFQRKLMTTLVMFTMPLRNSSSRMLDQQSIDRIPTLMKLQVK